MAFRTLSFANGTSATSDVSNATFRVSPGSVHQSFDYAPVPQWIAAEWPFRRPRCLGRDVTWQDWLALPRAW